MKNSSLYKMTAEIWLYPGETAAWHFISLPPQKAQEIHEQFADQKRGWGSLPVRVTIGKTTWKTSLFPDKKSDTYLLPLKAEVRKKEGLVAGERATLTLQMDEDISSDTVPQTQPEQEVGRAGPAFSFSRKESRRTFPLILVY